MSTERIVPERSAEWAERAVREALADPERSPTVGSAHLSREQEVLRRIERARRRKPTIKEERITLAHGAGGKATHTLIEAVFLEAFRNPLLAPLEDGVTLPLDGARAVFTTDSFVVSPLFFPGGDIGDLAVNGTVNDLAVCGARPRFLSAGFILEEGFPVADLRRITASMAEAAQAAGVSIVTGDTKVVQRGKADGCYINTAGVGLVERPVSLSVAAAKPGDAVSMAEAAQAAGVSIVTGDTKVVQRGKADGCYINTAGVGLVERPVSLSVAAAKPGDAVIVSGPIGEHGVTVMVARGELDIETDLTSDTAPLHGLVSRLLDAAPTQVRALRDATRGGVATILNEIAAASGVAVVVDEAALPVRPEVTGACELLGIDPLYVACEGRLVAVVDGAHADAALRALHGHPLGAGAAVVGRVADDPPGLVLLRTAFGGTRIVDLLVGDPLPRIC